MGEAKNHRPVLLIAAVSSRYESAIDDWTVETAGEQWGSVALQSPLFDFTQTSFYEKSMGTEIKKRLFAFEQLIDPGLLADCKLLSNQWELQYKSESQYPEQRPLNIDPGYLTEAKLILATTKDRDHRIYLRDGIFAEVTLYFKQGVWERSRWTYADYQLDEFHAFFDQCRAYLRTRYQNAGT